VPHTALIKPSPSEPPPLLLLLLLLLLLFWLSYKHAPAVSSIYSGACVERRRQ